MDAKKVAAEIEKFTPKTGANLVGVDSMEDAGEALYLIDHFATETEAKAARAAKMKEAGYNGDKLYVYTP